MVPQGNVRIMAVTCAGLCLDPGGAREVNCQGQHTASWYFRVARNVVVFYIYIYSKLVKVAAWPMQYRVSSFNDFFGCSLSVLVV